MCALRGKTPLTPECPGRLASLRSEQGIVSLAPLCGCPLKAKGVTAFVTPFSCFAVLRATPEPAALLLHRIQNASRYGWHLCFGMTFFVDGFQLLVDHVGVNLGRGYVAVPHQLLQGAEIRAVFQQMYRETVA